MRSVRLVVQYVYAQGDRSCTATVEEIEAYHKDTLTADDREGIRASLRLGSHHTPAASALPFITRQISEGKYHIVLKDETVKELMI